MKIGVARFLRTIRERIQTIEVVAFKQESWVS